jgi:hypothetical protein
MRLPQPSNSSPTSGFNRRWAAFTTERWAEQWYQMFRDVLGQNDLPFHEKLPETIAAK